MLTVLLVVGAGYAAWHYLPREQAVVAEKVPPVPDRLLASRPAPSSPTDARRQRLPRRLRDDDGRHAGAARPGSAQRTGHVAAPKYGRARRDSVAPPTQPRTQAAPLAPPVVVAVPAPPPPPVVMPIPAIGQAQAAQPPAPVDQPRVTTQQPAAVAPAPVEEAVARSARRRCGCRKPCR